MLSYEELLKRYTELLEENKTLKAENEQLRCRLGLLSSVQEVMVGKVTTVGLNKYSDSSEKITRFRSLFRGREDVFARRWQSQTSKKSGYQPVCINAWKEGVCDKRKYRCASCPNRELAPITDNDIYKHLEGKDPLCRDVIGIYPILEDGSCWFLCVDFDEESYQQDVTAFRETCAELNIPVAVERSRSGNGAHVWIFFEAPLSAAIARKLGSGLLTRTMEKRGGLSFKSYDRLFPNQDTVHSGGFGNLIALPLQGQGRKNGNTLFVDENFIPYEDQWFYLDKIQRIDAATVESLVLTLCKGGELGELIGDSDEKPWESKRKTKLTNKDFPIFLKIVRSNMLYIPTEGLSETAKNRIKRLAAFRNPDFYRAQAMRLPVYGKPRIICTAELSEEYIVMPRGCEEALCEILNNYLIFYEIQDKTNEGTAIPVAFNGELRAEQFPVAEALLEHNIGVLSATTAFGKTVIASYLIGKRKTNTLVLVHTQALMLQWKKALEQFLSFAMQPPEKTKGRGRKKAWAPVGMLGAGKNTLNGIVDVAVMQSLVSGDEVKELVRNYGMVIVDECHHVSAVNFEMILKHVNAKYVYGLTATPTRQDGHHPIIFMQCGAIRYRVDAKMQAEKRPFEHYLIPRFTFFRGVFGIKKGIASIYRELSEDERRNRLIVEDVIEALRNGRNPIILTERREHVSRLAELLEGHADHVIKLIGTISVKERRETLERLEQIPVSESLVVVATGKYVGEGFDYPRLDTLFLALPIAWKGKVAQYAGRLHRNYLGKTEVQVYDYVDIRVPVLESMYQKRLKSYVAIGYKSKISATLQNVPDLIYNGKSYYWRFCEDVKNAKREVVIVSPIIRKNRLIQMVKTFAFSLHNGATVTVITRSLDSLKEKERENIIACTEYLRECGIRVVFQSELYQKFAVIDQAIVWYGNVNFLSFGTEEENLMRFENYEIAGQLMDTIL